MPPCFRFVTRLSKALACMAGAFLAAAELGAQGQTSLPRLLAAELGPVPWNADTRRDVT